MYPTPANKRREALLLYKAYLASRRKRGESMSYYYGKKRERPPQQPASPHRAGHYAGLHDESQPFYSGNLTQKQTKGHHRPVQRLEKLPVDLDDMENYADADIDGNGDVWPPSNLATSVYRYNTVVPHGGNVRYELHPDQVQSIPRRRSATTQGQQVQGQWVRQAPQPTYAEDEDEDLRTGQPSGYRRRVHLPWYLLLAIGAVLALTVWIGGAWVNKWWVDTQNDWTYTAQFRTFSIDEVVGHNHDSTAHPSHFIVQNDKRHIIIIELPADDWSKAIIYSAPTLIGDGQEKTPATLTFQVDMQTGRLDMVLHVEDQTYLFTNNGTKFVTPQGQ